MPSGRDWQRVQTGCTVEETGRERETESAAVATGLRYVIKLTLACFMYADDKLVYYKNTVFFPVQS